MAVPSAQCIAFRGDVDPTAAKRLTISRLCGVLPPTMESFGISPSEATLALRALRTIATTDGHVADHERAFLAAASKALGVADAVDALDAVTPREVAAGISDPLHRTRLVQALLVMAMMDGKIPRAELDAIRAFALALDVDEPKLKDLELFLGGHLRLIQLDLNRRSEMIQAKFSRAWKDEGFEGVKHLVGAVVGVGAADPALAWRYKKLGLLPEGTLGREYWVHCTSRGFSFPGEPGMVMPRQLIVHDLCHVLGGYDTNALGECEVSAFIAGFIRTDPFWYVFAILMHMHMDVQVFGVDPTARLAGEPEAMIRALRRGMKVTRDLYNDWDFWPDMELPIDAVKAKLAVA